MWGVDRAVGGPGVLLATRAPRTAPTTTVTVAATSSAPGARWWRRGVARARLLRPGPATGRGGPRCACAPLGPGRGGWERGGGARGGWAQGGWARCGSGRLEAPGHWCPPGATGRGGAGTAGRGPAAVRRDQSSGPGGGRPMRTVGSSPERSSLGGARVAAGVGPVVRSGAQRRVMGWGARLVDLVPVAVGGHVDQGRLARVTSPFSHVDHHDVPHRPLRGGQGWSPSKGIAPEGTLNSTLSSGTTTTFESSGPRPLVSRSPGDEPVVHLGVDRLAHHLGDDRLAITMRQTGPGMASIAPRPQAGRWLTLAVHASRRP